MAEINLLGFEKVKTVEEQFLLFQNHSSFLIRERLYKGGNVYGNGLQPVHNEMIKLVEKFAKDPLSNEYHEAMETEFNSSVKKLNDTLDLLMFMIENDGDTDEILKLFQVIEIEIQELDEFHSRGFSFDPSTVQSDEDLAIQRIFDLGLKIDDNFTQISSSNEWRLRSGLPQVDSNIDLKELEHLIQKAKTSALENVSEDYLGLLSIMAINVRDIAAADLSRLRESILFYITASEILGKDLSYNSDEGIVITSQFVKDDIEHKVNLKNIDWLIKVHNSVTEEYPEEKYCEKFALLLYKLSRDVREEFLWTMLRLSREQSNPQLEDLSIGYASLASILLSVKNNLVEIGMNDIADAITQADEIKALDMIDDLVELYTLDNMGTEKLINAIRKQLDNLKLLAFQIIQMDDIRPTFQMFVQFTDMDANFDEMTLEDYINSLGN